MRYIPMLLAFLIVPANACFATEAEVSGTYVAGHGYFTEQQKMVYLRTIVAKLRETTKAMGDPSTFEAMGMPSNEIKRLQSAMKIKTQQLTDQALQLIRSL